MCSCETLPNSTESEYMLAYHAANKQATSKSKKKSKLHPPYNNLLGGRKLIQQLVKYSI